MKEKCSIGDVRAAVIKSKGGVCIGCDCGPKFKVMSPATGFVLRVGSQAMKHNLRPEQLQVRVVCDANPTSHRPFQGPNLESCCPRRHFKAKA